MFCYCFPARGQDKEKQRFSNWPQKKLKSKSLSPTHNPKKKKTLKNPRNTVGRGKLSA
jgi:hypothetical protein